MSKQSHTTRACATILDMLDLIGKPGSTDHDIAHIFVVNEFEFRTLFRYTMAALAKDLLQEDDE